MTCGAVILGAGKSSRMGRPKLLLPWRKTTVVGHLVSEWNRLAAAQIVVVVAANDEAVQHELERLSSARLVALHNARPEEGMFSSIRCAAKWPGWAQNLTHIAISLGDQPHLRRQTLLDLLVFAESHPSQICQPARKGRPRHPILLPRADFLALGVCPQTTLKEYLAGASIALLDCADEGLDLDIDRPEDYAHALKLDFPNPG